MGIVAVTASLDVGVRREDAGRDQNRMRGQNRVHSQDRVRGQNRDSVSHASGPDDMVMCACPRSATRIRRPAQRCFQSSRMIEVVCRVCGIR